MWFLVMYCSLYIPRVIPVRRISRSAQDLRLGRLNWVVRLFISSPRCSLRNDEARENIG